MQDQTSLAAGGGALYSLIFANNSNQTGSACVYQQDPNLGVPNALPLAWFTRMAAPHTHVAFQWMLDYSFVWAQTGMLVPGVVFETSQLFSADLSTANKTTLSNQGGYYNFQYPTQGPSPGSLYIVVDGTVPPGQVAVGIGMSGAATVAAQAQPNWNFVFTPRPQYWIAFGNYSQGQVLDATEVSNPAQVIFPPNVYSMMAVLNPDNTWSIQPAST